MSKHECVGAAQLAEKDATIATLHEQVAGYAAFHTEVMDIHTLRFKGEVRAPVDAEDLLSRIRLDHVLACTARSSAAKDGHGPMYNAGMSRAERTDPAETSARAAGWTNFEDSEDASLLVVAHDNRDVHFTGPEAWEQACQWEKDNELWNGVRMPSTCKHPSADAKPAVSSTGKQLDRIESLIGLIEPSNYFWPCVWSAAAGALAVLAYIKW